MSNSTPDGYVVQWTIPAGNGKVKYKWYMRRGDAKNCAKRLGDRGEGLDVRLLRATEFEDLSHELKEIYNPASAEEWAEWANSAWRKALLRHEPRWAKWVQVHPRAERALDWAETRFSRASRSSDSK